MCLIKWTLMYKDGIFCNFPTHSTYSVHIQYIAPLFPSLTEVREQLAANVVAIKTMLAPLASVRVRDVSGCCKDTGLPK